MQEIIGQMPYESPSVFSFFGPGYQPPGDFSKVSLVAPEAQILTMNTITGMLNGLSSLISNGLSPCQHGFGSSPKYIRSCRYPWGHLKYEPSSSADTAEKVIEELSVLLTSGRLSAENKATILQHYNIALSDGTPEALQTALHLIIASPEFHSMSKIRKTGALRQPSDTMRSTNDPYKAIITINLAGGMDSFYMLSPHLTCPLYTGKFYFFQ
jgi:hypothetical protein